MMSATDQLAAMDPTLRPGPYPDGGPYLWFDQTDDPKITFPSGVECQVGEFLHGLIRMLRPENVLETGTRLGIASRYILLGLLDNAKGHLVTIERCGYCYPRAVEKFELCGFESMVTPIHGDADGYTPDRVFDLMWIDTEPQTRYTEVVKFWPHLAVGGMVCIHDLASFHPDSPFGPLPEGLAKILAYEGQWMNFKTVTGLTLIQKIMSREGGPGRVGTNNHDSA